MDQMNPPPENKQPWWNDGDKVGGMASTIILLALVIFIACAVIAAGIGLVKIVS